MAQRLEKKEQMSSVSRHLLRADTAAAVTAPVDDEKIEPELPPAKPKREKVLQIRNNQKPVAETTKKQEAPPELMFADVPPPLSRKVYYLTEEMDQALDELTAAYKLSTKAQLTKSHVVRAMFTLMMNSLPGIKEQASTLPPMRLPGNQRGLEAQREAFEAQLVRTMEHALKERLGVG